MPPKTASMDMGAKSTNEGFLACCIKFAREKVMPDFDMVAKELGMSKGGASNKFRMVMRHFVEEDAASTKGTADASDTATIAGTKRRKAPASKKNGVKAAAKTGKSKDKAADTAATDDTDTSSRDAIDVTANATTTDNDSEDGYSEPEQPPAKKRKAPAANTKMKKAAAPASKKATKAARGAKKAKQEDEETRCENASHGDEGDDTLVPEKASSDVGADDD